MKRHRSIGLLAVLLVIGSVSLALGKENAKLVFKVKDLGTLGGTAAEALAINNKGQIVGRSTTKRDANGNGGVYHAFLYEGGRMKDLGLLPGSVSSAATGINDNGVIIGTSLCRAGCLVDEHPFRCSDGQMVPLRIEGADFVGPVAINVAGHFAGWCNNKGRIHAFIYDGRLRDLGTLDGNDHRGSEAFGLNNRGEVAGVASISNLGDTRAFLYTGGRMINLGTLPGHYASHAQGINNLSQVVGWSAPAYKVSPEPRAFLYANGKMIDLNLLLPKRSGWVLRQANGINDQGQIVGSGEHGGRRRAFLLLPDSRP